MHDTIHLRVIIFIVRCSIQMLILIITIPFAIVTYAFHYMLQHHLVDERNKWMGYRTPRSMKSPMHWQYAQRYFVQVSKLLTIIFSIIGVVWFIVDFMLHFNEWSLYIQMGVVAIYILLIFIVTEARLKQLD